MSFPMESADFQEETKEVIMTNFDLEALEKALSSKARKPRQDLSLKSALSKRDLWNEAVRLADEMYTIYNRKLRTRHQGDSYYIYSGRLIKNDYRHDDINNVPRPVFEKLIANGRRVLKDYHDMVNKLVMENPDVALEANLEGKTGNDVLKFAYNKRIEQIDNIFRSRVVCPTCNLYLNLPVTLRPPLGEEFRISVNWWSYRRYPSVNGIELYPKKPQEMAKLVHFLTYFEQVEREINRQLDEIEIRKEVSR